MKKNGFIAMSLIYTFSLVFVAVIFSILNFYLDNNLIMKKINRDIIDHYNSNYSTKKVTDLYFKNVFAPGDYVDFEIADINYPNGKWQILKADATNVYIVSSFIIADDIKSVYNDISLNTKYGAVFNNVNLIDSIRALTTSDLWQGYTISDLPFSSPLNKLYNVNYNYFVLNGADVHIVVPNCICGRDNYFSSYLQYNNVKAWNDAVCIPKGQTITPLSKCNAKFTIGGLNMLPNYVSGIRLVIKLRSDAILIGGKGTYDDSFRIGAKKV